MNGSDEHDSWQCRRCPSEQRTEYRKGWSVHQRTWLNFLLRTNHLAYMTLTRNGYFCSSWNFSGRLAGLAHKVPHGPFDICILLLRTWYFSQSFVFENGTYRALGYGHATRVSAFATHLRELDNPPTIHIISSAPKHVFEQAIGAGSLYRYAEIDPVIVQPLAYVPYT